MEVMVNGERRQIEPGTTVSALVEALGFKAERVAVERNQQVVRRGTWENTRLNEGDVIEILTFVGGG